MSRGTTRERQVRHQLEHDGWLVIRAAGSLGICDLVALKAGESPRLVEVKSDVRSPFNNFLPARRRELAQAAERAGGEAWLCWWPPRKTPQWIAADAWPAERVA